MSPFLSALLFLVLAAGPPFDEAAADGVCSAARKASGAPGIAVAIVREDEVIYLKGHGVRELGRPEAVTPDTIFAIGSVTKAFTATAIGQLVDEGKAKWDDPVRQHLPWFRLTDPLADRDVTLRDLLCHRTGLGPHNFLWYRAGWPVEESVRRMAFLEPVHSFREKYDYNNLAYLAAGLAAAQTAKTSWRDLVQKKLLDPLGMKGTVFTSSEAIAAADHATPHWRNRGGTVQPVAWYPDDRHLRPSGSIKCGVRDLARWVRCQLNEGTLDGKRIVSAEALAETHAPQMVERRGGRFNGATQVSYGLGWRILDYRRNPVLEHGGAVDGFRAQILLLPKQRAGIVVLVNLDDTSAATETAYALADVLLGVKERAHSRGVRPAAAKRLAESGPRSKPTRELNAYVGTYEEKAYGTATVTRDGERLMLAWSSFSLPLRHVRFNTFAVPADVPYGSHKLAEESALFMLDADGTVARLRFLGRTFKRSK